MTPTYANIKETFYGTLRKSSISASRQFGPMTLRAAENYFWNTRQWLLTGALSWQFRHPFNQNQIITATGTINQTCYAWANSADSEPGPRFFRELGGNLGTTRISGDATRTDSNTESSTASFTLNLYRTMRRADVNDYHADWSLSLNASGVTVSPPCTITLTLPDGETEVTKTGSGGLISCDLELSKNEGWTEANGGQSY